MSPTRYDSSGRVQPIEYRNLAVPAECLLCKRIGSSPDEIFADLRVELAFYGDCYMCQNCCHELASFVMAVSFERHQQVKDENSVLDTRVVGLIKKVNYLKGLLDARIDSSGRSEPDSDGTVGVPLLEVEPLTTFLDSVLDSDKPVSS